MRKRLFQIIDVPEEGNKLSNIYDLLMIAVIIISLIPLAFKEDYPVFTVIEYSSACIFILDYLVRWATADYKLKKGLRSFLLYPATPMAIIDLLAILATLSLLESGFRVLKLFRLFRAFRVLRIFKMLRYSKSILIIENVISRQKEALMAVFILAVAYIIICALIIFNVEPDTFEDFFEAVYWATISLTTLGYGDIYPLSITGRIVTMLSSFIGIAIVALPSGIITAGYMEEIRKESAEIPADSEDKL